MGNKSEYIPMVWVDAWLRYCAEMMIIIDYLENMKDSSPPRYVQIDKKSIARMEKYEYKFNKSLKLEKK